VSGTYTELNVAAQLEDPSSVLNFYRKLTALRRQKPALYMGSYERLESASDILAYRRSYQNSDIYVMLNFSGKQQQFTNSTNGRWITLMGTHRAAKDVIGQGSISMEPYEVIIAESAR
jgi:glycosidase